MTRSFRIINQECDCSGDLKKILYCCKIRSLPQLQNDASIIFVHTNSWYAKVQNCIIGKIGHSSYHNWQQMVTLVSFNIKWTGTVSTAKLLSRTEGKNWYTGCPRILRIQTVRFHYSMVNFLVPKYSILKWN